MGASSRYIAFEVRPVLETKGNDESKNVESFLTLAEASATYRAEVIKVGLDNFSIFSADDPTDSELEDIAAWNDIRLFWTLYGVNPDGTSEAITDTETEAQAFEMLAKLTGISGVSGTVRYSVAPAAPADVRERLEYLRGELRAERISYDELSELESLVSHISPDDVELLEAAGVPEFPDQPAPDGTIDGHPAIQTADNGLVVVRKSEHGQRPSAAPVSADDDYRAIGEDV